MRPKKITVWIAASVAFVALLVGASRLDAVRGRIPWLAKKDASERAGQAARGDVEVHFKEAGELEAKLDVQVRPPVDGQVNHVLVQEGDSVKRGQILAMIQPGKTEAEQKLYVATPIRAPMDGIILYMNTNDGDVTTAGKDDFIHVADLRTMIVRLEIGEADILKVKAGQRATVTVDALQGETYHGKIYFISPGAIEGPKKNNDSRPQQNPGPKKFLVKVELERSDPRFKSGMTARADLLLDKRAATVKVPLEALFEDMGKASVYVKVPSGIEQREVRLGLRNDEEVEVLEGVSEKETVLLEKPVGPVTTVALKTAEKGK